MRQRGGYREISRTVLVLGGVLFLGAQVQAQGNSASTVPDAQIEANVLKALASEPQLANENIISNTVYGTVTLSGTVKDESNRVLAETLASKASGVKKVVDELTLGAATDAAQGPNAMAPQYGQNQDHAPDPDAYAAQHGLDPSTGENASSASPADNGSAPDGPPQGGGGYSDNGQPSYPQGQQPPPNRYSQRNAPPPYGAQVAGQPVTIPAGTMLRTRINEGLDSKHTQPGTPFDAIVLNDVVADGAVAIPRGASVQGTVVDAKSGGVLKGHGTLSLRLEQVTLGGKTFPIASDVWSRDSMDKTGQTVGNAVGLGAMGALLGAVAGGGAGAAIGAGVGGAAGLGTSAASGSRQVLIPSEAILTFHLAQPATLTTISQAEMDRLSSGVPTGAARPRMYRRRPPSPYGPGYYPPPPYPYPY